MQVRRDWDHFPVINTLPQLSYDQDLEKSSVVVSKWLKEGIVIT